MEVELFRLLRRYEKARRLSASRASFVSPHSCLRHALFAGLNVRSRQVSHSIGFTEKQVLIPTNQFHFQGAFNLLMQCHL